MDHDEEQELEAEALAAIFDESFEIISSSPNHWKVRLYPVDCDDEAESDEANFVGCNLIVNLPEDYPEVLPELDVQIIKGLAQEQKEILLTIAMEEAEQYTGMPAIYSVCEAIRAWLMDNNVKGLDDQSMHAQMMRRAREEELKKEQKQQQFESQKLKEEMTQAESEEIAVRKRRAEGTPCTKENFNEWKEKFEKEIEEKEEREEAQALKDQTNSKKKGSNVKTVEEEQEGRLTGFQQFTEKQGLMNLDALERAAEAAEKEDSQLDVEDLDVDEDLFDDESDFDDLDFEDSDDDDDESDDDDDSDEDDLDI